jgi:hypothetical protein
MLGDERKQEMKAAWEPRASLLPHQRNKYRKMRKS